MTQYEVKHWNTRAHGYTVPAVTMNSPKRANELLGQTLSLAAILRDGGSGWGAQGRHLGGNRWTQPIASGATRRRTKRVESHRTMVSHVCMFSLQNPLTTIIAISDEETKEMTKADPS